MTQSYVMRYAVGMITCTIDELHHPENTMNVHMRRCIIRRGDTVLGRVHVRKPELLGPEVRRVLRVMGIYGFPVMVSNDEWHIKEDGDGATE